MSSPPVTSNGTHDRRSGESSPRATSSPSHRSVNHNGRSPLSSSNTADVQPQNRTNGHISSSSRANGSPYSSKTKLGRAGGFLLASTFKTKSRNDRVKAEGPNAVNGTSVGEEVKPDEGTPGSMEGREDVRISAELSRDLTTRLSSATTDSHAIGPGLVDLIQPDRSGSEDFGIQQHFVPFDARDRLAGLQPSSLIDPSQIVSMALNLSEGRRRNMSSQSPTATISSSARIVSSTNPAIPKTNNTGTGGSLKKHLQDQRRASRHLAADNGSKSPTARPMSSGIDAPGYDPSLQIRLSTATLARAGKARQYFELSGQYRRMLANLPPLLHGPNSTGATHAGQAYSQAHHHDSMTSLGRDYNPLQVIRNRKARARARKTLNPRPEMWQNPAAVDDWLNVIENVAHGTSYIQGISVNLPRYPPKQYAHLIASNQSAEENPGGTTTKPSRPRLDWLVTPPELLADAYWLEHDENKTIIEDRQGCKLYTPFALSRDPKLSLDGRSSFAGSAHVSIPSEQAHDSETESFHELRGRRQDGATEMAAHDGSGRLKQAWHKARGHSRSRSSDLSASEDETNDKLLSKMIRQNLDNLNTGPLERHLGSMIHGEHLALGPDPQSPGLISPITPDRGGLQSRHTSGDTTDLQQNGQTQKSSLRLQTSNQVQSAISTTSFMPHEQRRSLEHSSPGSPSINKPLLRSKTDLLPPDDRTASPTRRKSYLHFSRSGPRKLDPAPHLHDESDMSSRRQSEDFKSGRHSLENARSYKGRDLAQVARLNTSLSYLASSPQSRARDARGRETDSAVRRFFKGGLSGLRRRERDGSEDLVDNHGLTDGEAASMDESDTEDTSGTGGLKAQDRAHRVLRRSKTSHLEATGDTAVNSVSKRQHHADLPIFKSSVRPASYSRPTSPAAEIMVKQQSSSQSPLKDGPSPLPYSMEGGTLADSYTSLAMVPSNSSVFDSPTMPLPRLRRGLLSHFNTRSQSRNAVEKHDSLSRDTTAPSTEATKTTLGLAALQEARSPSLMIPSLQRQPSADRNRQWSISDADVRRASAAFPSSTDSRISHCEIMHIKALLICTGVKAAALARRSYPDNTRVSERPAGMSLSTNRAAIAARARQATHNFDAESKKLHASVEAFRRDTVAPLHDTLREMRICGSECADMARTAGDEAIGFGALITGQKTIEVRRVLDQMERFRRKRRRRVRWIRRVGYGILEWSVLFIMWQVWLVVVIFKAAWSVVKGTFKVGRWALWL